MTAHHSVGRVPKPVASCMQHTEATALLVKDRSSNFAA